MKRISALVASVLLPVALISAPSAAHADESGQCVGVKTVKVVKGKRVVTTSYSCAVIVTPPGRTPYRTNAIDWD